MFNEIDWNKRESSREEGLYIHAKQRIKPNDRIGRSEKKLKKKIGKFPSTLCYAIPIDHRDHLGQGRSSFHPLPLPREIHSRDCFVFQQRL